MTAHPAHGDRQRWIALYVLCIGMLMIVLDVTVVNVALPSIQNDLHFSPSSLAWVVNAYLISFGGFLLLAGRLGDLTSRRNVFLLGLVVFTAASAACGFASSGPVLIGARFVQGLGGALTSAGILGMIVTMFPEPREQAKAIGVFAFVASAGGSIGLLAGGVLTQSLTWHWIFFINLPIGVATGVLALRLLERGEGPGLRRGTDVLGAVLVTGALMLLVYTIVKPAVEHGWGSATTLTFLAAAIVLLVAFIVREATASNPLMPLRIFRAPNIAGANVAQALLMPGMFGTFFLGALYLQKVLHYDAIEIGLAFLPATVIMGGMAFRFSETLITRFGAKRVLLVGVIPFPIALLLFTQAPVSGGYAAHILPVVTLFGLGAGVAFPALMNIAMSGAEPRDAGLASALVNSSAQVGGALGLALLASIAATRTTHLQDAGQTVASSLNGGYHLAYLIAAGFVLVGIAVAAVTLREPEPVVVSEAERRSEPAAVCTEAA